MRTSKLKKTDERGTIARNNVNNTVVGLFSSPTTNYRLTLRACNIIIVVVLDAVRLKNFRRNFRPAGAGDGGGVVRLRQWDDANLRNVI